METAKKFKYEILPEHNLIIESWAGEFDLKEIIELKNQEASNPNWKDYYDVLADDRYMHIKNLHIDEKINEYLPLSQKLIKKRKTALLTRWPNQVANSTLLLLKKPTDVPIQVEIFSTIEAALKWLEINLKEMKQINRILEELAKD